MGHSWELYPGQLEDSELQLNKESISEKEGSDAGEVRHSWEHTCGIMSKRTNEFIVGKAKQCELPEEQQRRVSTWRGAR